jgi:predicted nucleotidyltransferase
MIDKSSTEKVLAHFFTFPTEEVHLRKLSRQLGLSLPTIIMATKKLEQEGLITVKHGRPLTLTRAALTERFTRRKRVHNLEQVYESGLLESISKARPDAIILFGSYSRGEDTERSDIDIAILKGNGKRLVLDAFEHKLHRKISVHSIDDHMNKRLIENLKNGIVLEGTL